MYDALDLVLHQFFSLVQVYDHRSRRGVFLFNEKGLFSDNDVNPAAFNLFEFVDGAAQLTLQGSLVVDILNKIGHPELNVVKNFKSDAAALGQPL